MKNNPILQKKNLKYPNKIGDFIEFPCLHIALQIALKSSKYDTTGFEYHT